MTIPVLIRRVLFFNQYGRDRWVRSQAAKLPVGSRILDVGAGSCPYRAAFGHCRYQTHDFANLGSSELTGGKGYGALDFTSDIVDIPVPDQSFDAVLCTEVLEHVPDPAAGVKELARILKAGGRLYLTAPLGSGLHQEPYHFYGGYTPHWYRKFLEEAGFESVTIEANGGFFKFYGQESIRFALLLAPWRGLRNALLAPFWLLSLPWFAFLCPILCSLLDPLDRQRAFTVGYHVTAVRRH